MPLFARSKKEEPAEPGFPEGTPLPEQPYYPNQPMEMQQGYPPQQAYEQQMPPPGPAPAPQWPMPPPGGMPPQMPMPGAPVDKERIEEVAEAIIDEKWNELLKDINKMIEWKEKTESRLLRIEQDITNLKANFESLHKGILGKISEYDQNLVDVGTEIKAMEKVFQKVLPTFTENVNKLSRLTKDVALSPAKKK